MKVSPEVVSSLRYLIREVNRVWSPTPDRFHAPAVASTANMIVRGLLRLAESERSPIKSQIAPALTAARRLAKVANKRRGWHEQSHPAIELGICLGAVLRVADSQPQKESQHETPTH